MNLFEKGLVDVFYISDFLCKYIVIIVLIVLLIFKKKLLYKKWEIIFRFKICFICILKFMFIFF